MSQLGIMLQPIHQVMQEDASLEAQSKKSLFNRLRLWYKHPVYVSHMIQQTSWYQRDVWWKEQLVQPLESPNRRVTGRPMGSGAKPCNLKQRTIHHSKKQLLAC